MNIYIYINTVFLDGNKGMIWVILPISILLSLITVNDYHFCVFHYQLSWLVSVWLWETYLSNPYTRICMLIHTVTNSLELRYSFGCYFDVGPSDIDMYIYICSGRNQDVGLNHWFHPPSPISAISMHWHTHMKPYNGAVFTTGCPYSLPLDTDTGDKSMLHSLQYTWALLRYLHRAWLIQGKCRYLATHF